MQIPLEITYRDVESTPTIDNLVRERTAKLEQVCDHISSCRVAIERPNKHPRFGSGWRVRIDMTVPPGHEVVAIRESNEGSVRDDLFAVIQSAFQAARRQLIRVNSQQHGAVKQHPAQQVVAVVGKLMDGYGFLLTSDGREVYFHRNSILDLEWEELREGMGVAYMEEEGEDGPQATTVRVVDRRGGQRPESVVLEREEPKGPEREVPEEARVSPQSMSPRE